MNSTVGKYNHPHEVFTNVFVCIYIPATLPGLQAGSGLILPFLRDSEDLLQFSHGLFHSVVGSQAHPRVYQPLHQLQGDAVRLGQGDTHLGCDEESMCYMKPQLKLCQATQTGCGCCMSAPHRASGPAGAPVSVEGALAALHPGRYPGPIVPAAWRNRASRLTVPPGLARGSPPHSPVTPEDTGGDRQIGRNGVR